MMLSIVILEKSTEVEQTLPHSQLSSVSEMEKPKTSKSQIRLKKKIRQLQLSLDILDMETDSQNSFKDWFLNQFVMPYTYRIPQTVQYLLSKLEMEDFAKDLNISFC
jgi:hypothetical protein